jgi:hypothetical protein
VTSERFSFLASDRFGFLESRVLPRWGRWFYRPLLIVWIFFLVVSALGRGVPIYVPVIWVIASSLVLLVDAAARRRVDALIRSGRKPVYSTPD